MVLVLFSVLSCNGVKNTKLDPTKDPILFNKHIIDFENTITESIELNHTNYDGLLQGAGVSIININNDTLPDIYFCSNMGEDKLFLNLGSFNFKDITSNSGISNTNWSTGAAIVDINQDGYDDIYLCQFLYDDPALRKNKLFINNGDNSFTEHAKSFGIDDDGHSIMANFFDADHDGDLDLLLVNQPPNSFVFKKRLNKNKNLLADHQTKFYENIEGKFSHNPGFGLNNKGYNLSSLTADFNSDGFTDVFVSTDYARPDGLFYNQNGKIFENTYLSNFRHMPNFSMGSDVADFNNDGWLDLFVLDMVAEDNFRQKTNMSGMNPKQFNQFVSQGFHHQYMSNSLQLNNGDGSFSEIGQLSGVSNTDWSWSPLFIDFDQDGWKDILVTNGIFKEVRNKDFYNFQKKWKRKNGIKDGSKDPLILELLEQFPSVKISNYVFQNNKDLTFTNKSAEWGLDEPNWSQGAAYADLDNDGDLDLVINNSNMPATIYKNGANEKNLNNYLNIKLTSIESDAKTLNSLVKIHTGDQIQSWNYSPYRGYMSTSQKIAHFGIGINEKVDKVEVFWPDGKYTVYQDVPANQKFEIAYENSNEKRAKKTIKENLFQSVKSQLAHKENYFNDFERETLLPYKMSSLGPYTAKGDINGDGLEDFYISGSHTQAGRIYIQGRNTEFTLAQTFTNEKEYEDGGACFFDSDNDGDLDLYVSSGGNEFIIASKKYQDRLYINNGSGSFKLSDQLPLMTESTGVICPLDFDRDGDLDLFIAGRQIPGKYGLAPNSFILENTNGKFEDITDQYAPFLKEFGMVTDAVFGNVDQDPENELIICGEWMPIKIFDVKKNHLEEISNHFNLEKTHGLWNKIQLSDIDQDGDLDILAGNIGLNIKYKASIDKPFKLFVDDFDGNGSHDTYLGIYEGDKCFPVRGRQCSSEQMPYISKKYKTYNEFASATIQDVLDEKMSDSTLELNTYNLANTLFLNENGKQFKSLILPNEAQISPIYGIEEIAIDGTKSLVCVGNFYDREVETTRSDAGTGFMLSMDKSKIAIKRGTELGFKANKDARSILSLNGGNKKVIAVANNNDFLQFFTF